MSDPQQPTARQSDVQIEVVGDPARLSRIVEAVSRPLQPLAERARHVTYQGVGR